MLTSEIKTALVTYDNNYFGNAKLRLSIFAIKPGTASYVRCSGGSAVKLFQEQSAWFSHLTAVSKNLCKKSDLKDGKNTMTQFVTRRHTKEVGFSL